MNLLMIIVFSVGLQTWVWNTGGMYKKWYLNTLESSFILNLVLLAATTYHVRLVGGDQAAVVYLQVTVAFVTFITIIFYHVYQQVMESRAWRNSIHPYLHRLRLRVKKNWQGVTIKMGENTTQSPAENQVVPTTTFITLREALLDSTA